MSHIAGYSVSPTGSLWIRLHDGESRPATKEEWLFIWRDNPFLISALPS